MPSSVPSLPAVMIYNGNGNDNSMAIATSKGTPRRRCRRHQLHHSIHLWSFLYMLIVMSCIMNSYTSRNCGSSSGFVGNTNNFFLVAAADNVNESNDNDGDGGDDDDDDDDDGDDDEAADGGVAASGDTSGDTKDDDVGDYYYVGDAFDDRLDSTEGEHEGDYDYVYTPIESVEEELAAFTENTSSGNAYEHETESEKGDKDDYEYYYDGSEEDNNDDIEGEYQGEIEDIFMSSEDVTCMEETWDFFVDNPELEQACDEYAETIQDQQQNNNNDNSNNLYDTRQEINGIQTIVISYPDDTITALEEVCYDYKGYWMSITNSDTENDTTDHPLVFMCTVMDTESIKVVVNNYGQCLADVDVCHTLDSAKVLESAFGEMDLACYEGDGIDDKPDNFDEITQQVDEEYFDQELNTNADDDGYIDEDFGFDFEEGTMEDLLDEIEDGMSETDKQCFEDTMKFNQKSETIEAAYIDYASTMTTNIDDIIAILVDGSVNDFNATEEDTPSVVSLEMGFSDKGVAMLQEVCTANSGYFSLIEEESISCTVTNDQTSTVQLTVTNVADCLANTDECHTYTILSGIENIWTDYGLDCSASTSSSSTGISSSTSTTSTSSSSSSSSSSTSSSSGESATKPSLSSTTSTNTESAAATVTETGGSDDGDAGPGACYDISIHVCNCDVGSCNAELCAASNGIWTVDCPNHCTNCNSATANESSSSTTTAESSTPTMATEGHSPSDSNINDISSSSSTTTQTSSEDEENSSLTMSNDDTASTSSLFSGWFGGSNGGGNGSSINDGIPLSYLIIGISIIAIFSIGGFIMIRQRRNRILGIGRRGRGGGRGGGGGRHSKVEMTDMSYDLDLELT